MRARVLKAVEELDYKPDILAQSLRRRETMTIGFAVSDISNPVVSQIVKGAEVTLRDAGYTMLLTNSLVDPELDRRHIELLHQRRADGLLLLTVSEDHQPTITALERLDIPIVVVERDLPASVGAAGAYSDHRAGMDPAVEHLIDLGHRRIAFIAGQPVRPTRERVASLKAVFTRRGLAPTYQVYEGSYSTEHGAHITNLLLGAENPPTAIIAGSNQLMVGALKVLSERGVAIGQDLSFVGCDDITVAQIHRPQIAVLHRDLVALGTSAAELLLRRLHDDAATDSVILPTHFVPRPSCGPAPRPAGGLL